MTPTDSTGSFPADTEGAIYYDDSQSQLKHYNGDGWISMNTNINYDRPGDGPYTSDDYTVLLIHADNSSADSSGNGNTMGGNTTFSSTSKLGSHSIEHSNTYGQWTDTTDWDLGNVFTIDFWSYSHSKGSYDRWIGGGTNANGSNGEHWFFGKWPNDQFNFGYYNGSGYTETAASVGTWNLNTWYHVALVRTGSYLDIYWNGVRKVHWDVGNQSFNTGAQSLITGYRWSYGSRIEPFDGYMDELRISKGIARWTSDFTVY
jgi:hypothetical protein